jgi:hypothetical protein
VKVPMLRAQVQQPPDGQSPGTLHWEITYSPPRQNLFGLHDILCRYEPGNPSTYVTVVCTNVGADYTSLGNHAWPTPGC